MTADADGVHRNADYWKQVDAVAATAPPLTDQQRDRIAAILRGSPASAPNAA